MKSLSPLGRSIVDAGRDGDRSTAADRKRVRAKIAGALAAGAVVTGAASGGTALAAAGKAGAASWGLSWIVAPIAIAATAAGVVTTVDRAERSASPQRAALVAPAVAARVRATVNASAPEPAGVDAAPPSDDASRSTSPPPAPTATTRATSVAVAPSVPAPDPLVAETRRLAEAQQALAAGDPTRALALLDERGAQSGQLAEERAAMHAIALCREGRVAEGRAAVSRFLKERPASPYAARVQAACTD
jgi:hypothetical protein